MGAEKVDGFPRTRRGAVPLYPFREIAGDGGVWRIDPGDYGVKLDSVRNAAQAWAPRNGYEVRTQAADGSLYVQFTKATP